MQTLRTFSYAGPNRRSDATVIEKKLAFTATEIETFCQIGSASACEHLLQIHPMLCIEKPNNTQGPLKELGEIFTRICIALQRAAGHQVSDIKVINVTAPTICQCWFEYEEPESGEEAALIAQDTISLMLKSISRPNNGSQGANAEQVFLCERIEHYQQQAGGKAMPADSRAIYDAALKRNIPILRMDRPPYRLIEGDFRLRYHGLFSIGYGCKQQTVDGTFCIHRSEASFPFIRDRKALFQKLAQLSIPLPKGDLDNWCQGPARAGRLAERLGYPVFLRTDQRGAGRFCGIALQNREAVMQAARESLANNTQLLVQAASPGDTFKLLVSGGKVIVCLAKNEKTNDWQPIADIHPATSSLALKIADTFQVGIALVTLAASDIKAEPQHENLAVLDIELAPHLDQLFTNDDGYLKQTAESFIDWMFPSAPEARIPIVAVTGTNGKTTTCRMLDKIFTATGATTGLACSDGCYISGDKVSEYEDATLLGHLTLLTNPSVETAVLETTRGSAGSIGLGFDRCDVAVCLNVTADHLNDYLETDTIEALAAIKRSIIERASHAVVLNADDAPCLAMVPYVSDRSIGLVSLQKTASELGDIAGNIYATALLETIDNKPWVVIYQGAERFAVIAAEEIPLAFGGAAEHNLINAMHAALAAHFMGVTTDVVATGLRNLAATFSAAPGRLSFYRDLPFDVCMDYAHNPAGVTALCKFIDQLEVKGRRVIGLSCSNNNSDEFIRQTAAAAAGHFDHYVCKNFGKIFERTIEEGPRLLRDGLLAAGVPPEAITCLEVEEEKAIDEILARGREGDLLVIVGGKRRQQFWRQITAAGEATRNT